MKPRCRSSRFAPCIQPLECRQLLSSSLPGAANTIYLDFDGNTLNGTFWNSIAGGVPIVTPAFNGTAETIDKIWQRVSEDFAPFNVNVTTDSPGPAANSVTVLIGGSYSDWYKTPSGGVAFTGTFGMGIPTFVFGDSLGNNEQAVAEAISHEAGHTLGLGHDGVIGGVEYYAGHGNWSTIMGNSYTAHVTQWSRGEYIGASNTQDDVAMLGSRLGFRADEATRELTGLVNVAGVINHATDTDAFTFTTTGGTVSLSINPASVGANLDVYAMLLNSAGAVVAVSNPGDRLSADINAMLPAGTYTLVLDGVGAASYSDYGSLGQYFVTGVVPGNEPPPPVTTDLIVGFAPQYGEAQRSFVYHFELTVVDSLMLNVRELYANNGMRITHYDINGENSRLVSLGSVSQRGQTLVFDFGTQGIGGSAMSTAADGTYVAEFDLNQDSVFESSREFHRLLGDVDGDGEVTAAELDAGYAAQLVAPRGTYLHELDFNRDGFSTLNDRFFMWQSIGRKVRK